MSDHPARDPRQGDSQHERGHTETQKESRRQVTTPTSADQPRVTYGGSGYNQPADQGRTSSAHLQERDTQSPRQDPGDQADQSSQAWSMGGHSYQHIGPLSISGPAQPQTRVATWVSSVRAASPIDPHTTTASDVESHYSGPSNPSRQPSPDRQDLLYILPPGTQLPERLEREERENQVVIVENSRRNRRREEREGRRDVNNGAGFLVEPGYRELRHDSGRVLSAPNTRIQKSKSPTNTTNDRRLRHNPTVNHQEKKETSKAKTKKPLPSYLQRNKADAASDPNRKTWLFKFPRELLHHISSYLSPESAICLTLTCKLALHTLGTSWWEDEGIRKRWYVDPTTMSVPRTLLMELLCRDAEELGLEFCKACNTLHPPLKRPNEHRQTKLTKYCWGQDAIIDYLPQGKDGLGYGLVFDHIKQAMSTASPDSSVPIEHLSGSFRVPHPYLNYSVSSSARRIEGNLVLRHEYCFSHSSRAVLKATDILDLPFRICPHQTVIVEPPPKNRYIRNSNSNGPLFTHSIVSAFPVLRRAGVPKPCVFRKSTPLERQMMFSADNGEDVIFKCRSCATKWKVEYLRGSDGEGRAEIRIAVYHCFFKELYSAARCWPWLVRREGELLGEGKRNSEYWSQGRSYSDFKID
ncbi:uncharacterized protein F4822DRAFT_434730 [Hypoxylon trugodes]|uniref:uncharacterized protein n=1 Tax=Hypoxylon trugodes TaxID=326681 RepID=UPI0021982029|nr:uncharacterized protein F4822DRAFT_434730 [Hypoxylon trugodes]KAI1383616.1 hypothetical protein F4822DRAFT_434730 [Hypoxylon trugodes]